MRRLIFSEPFSKLFNGLHFELSEKGKIACFFMLPDLQAISPHTNHQEYIKLPAAGCQIHGCDLYHCLFPGTWVSNSCFFI